MVFCIVNNIVGINVFMNYIIRMNLCQGFRKLDGNIEECINGKFSILQKIGKGFPRSIF